MKRCGGSEAWSAENCAAATVFCESECVVWLASKERARSREAFLRSVRGVLKCLAIDVTRLRGRWLVLAEDSVVRAEAARRATGAAATARELAFSLAHRKLSVAQNRNGRATS